MASSSESKSKKEPASHKFIVLVLGLLVGFVIGFVLLLSRLPVDDSLAGLKARETVAEPRRSDRFSFYDLLPAQSDPSPVRPAAGSVDPVVKVIEREPPAFKPEVPVNRNIPPATRPVPPNAQNLNGRYRIVDANFSESGTRSYFLQAGNFGSNAEAQSMRAQVTLLGLQAFVVEREEPGGQVRHRVRVGPFTELGLLTEAKKRLKRGGIRYEIVRVTS